MDECIPAIPVGNNAPFVAYSRKNLGVADGCVRGLPVPARLGPAIPNAIGRAAFLLPAAVRRRSRGGRQRMSQQ